MRNLRYLSAVWGSSVYQKPTCLYLGLKVASSGKCIYSTMGTLPTNHRYVGMSISTNLGLYFFTAFSAGHQTRSLM